MSYMEYYIIIIYLIFKEIYIRSEIVLGIYPRILKHLYSSCCN